MSMSQHTVETLADVASRTAPIPPVAVGVTAILGMDWDTAVKVVTIIYFVVLMAHKCWKWRNEHQDRKAGRCLRGDDE